MDTPAPHHTPDAVAPALAALTRWARPALSRTLSLERHRSVDDLVQDVFVAWVTAGRPHADDPDALQSLLRGMAVHKALDARRVSLSRKRFQGELPETDLPANALDPERAALAHELLGRLSESDRALVLAHAVEERPFTELAAHHCYRGAE